MKNIYHTRQALALITLLTVGLKTVHAQQECPKNDPSISCTAVTVPCPKTPGYRFSSCNGGVVTRISLGPVTVFHNSLAPSSPNEGMGPGWTMLDTVTPNTNGVTLRGADGGPTTFIAQVVTRRGTTPVIFESADKLRGDLRVIQSLSPEGYQLVDPDGSSISFTKGAGRSFYPTLYVSPLGVTTTLRYDSPGSLVPTLISTQGAPPISLNVSNGILRTVTYRDMAIWLMYDDQKRFTSVKNPDGSEVKLSYNVLGAISSITDPFNRVQRYRYNMQGNDGSLVLSSYSDPDNKRSAFTYTADKSTVASADAVEEIRWYKYGSSPDTVFPWVTSALTQPSSRNELALPGQSGGSSGSPTLLRAAQGSSLPLRVVRTLLVDDAGRPITITTDNGKVDLFYDLKGTCKQVPTQESSPFPTCIISSDGSKITSVVDPANGYVPLSTQRFGRAGLISSKTVSWKALPAIGNIAIRPRLLSVRTTANGKTVNSTTLSYKSGASLPYQIDTDTVTQIGWDTGKALPTSVLYPGGDSITRSYSGKGELFSETVNGTTTTINRKVEIDGTVLTTRRSPLYTSSHKTNAGGTKSSRTTSVLYDSSSKGSFNFTPINPAAGGDSQAAAITSVQNEEFDPASDGGVSGTTSCQGPDTSCDCTITCTPKADGTGCDYTRSCECGPIVTITEDPTPVPEPVKISVNITGGPGRVTDAKGELINCAIQEGDTGPSGTCEATTLATSLKLFASTEAGSSFQGWKRPASCEAIVGEPGDRHYQTDCEVPMLGVANYASAEFKACLKDGKRKGTIDNCCAGVAMCGANCGCAPGRSCVNNQCLRSCVPSCADKSCGGDDGCGGTCESGTCPSGQSCTSGRCISTCTPSCAGKSCGGDDGCGGTCQSGTCPSGQSCTSGRCVSTCKPNCAGKSCGDNGCGGSCGRCKSGETCNSGTCNPPVCNPNCAGKSCGDDGCGGTCGQCSSPKSCVNGTCSCTPRCDGSTCSEDGCGGTCICPAGRTCDASKQCRAQACKPAAYTCASNSECCTGKCDVAKRVCMPAVVGPGM